MAMNIGTELGAMPAKVSENIRATVTAGLAKLVELVNQYAAVMYPATANATLFVRPVRRLPKNHRHQAEGGDDFTEPQAATGAVGGGDADRVEVEHEVGQHRTQEPASELGGDERSRVSRLHEAEQPLDQSHHRVEGGRHRLEGQDQGDKRRPGDETVLKELQPHVVR